MPATDIAIVGWAQTPAVARTDATEPQLCMQANLAAIAMAGIERSDIGFTCAGSCDYLTGGPFAFVQNLDAAGAWPPIAESHVEMDGAWALYEAWVRLQHGDIDVALVFVSGKSSPSDPAELYPQQLDPYYLEPLGLDPASIAALQARALLDTGRATERDFAEVVARSRRDARTNPNAHVRDEDDPERLLAAPYTRNPLRAHDVYRQAGITDPKAQIDVAELYVPFSWYEPMWLEGHDIAPPGGGWKMVDDGETEIEGAFPVNPSGGVLSSNPIGASGMLRMAEAANQVRGQAGEHQVDGARVSLGQAYGGNAQYFAMAIFSSTRS